MKKLDAFGNAPPIGRFEVELEGLNSLFSESRNVANINTHSEGLWASSIFQKFSSKLGIFCQTESAMYF